MFEVINMGIPHLRSEQILALYVAEASHLEPDIVTYYGGGNDSVRIERSRGYLFARRMSLFFYFVSDLAGGRRYFDKSFVGNHIRGKADTFLSNLDALNSRIRKDGGIFVVVTQQMKSHAVPPNEIRGVTYEEEVALVREKLVREGQVQFREMVMLAHSEVMSSVREWAPRKNVALVDVIKEMNQERDLLARKSWVHLRPEGNRVIAEALAEEIEKLVGSRAAGEVGAEAEVADR